MGVVEADDCGSLVDSVDDCPGPPAAQGTEAPTKQQPSSASAFRDPNVEHRTCKDTRHRNYGMSFSSLRRGIRKGRSSALIWKLHNSQSTVPCGAFFAVVRLKVSLLLHRKLCTPEERTRRS